MEPNSISTEYLISVPLSSVKLEIIGALLKNCQMSGTPKALTRVNIALQFVSEFTGNKMEGEKLERVYHKIKSGKASAAAVHSIGAGNSGKHLPLRNRVERHEPIAFSLSGTLSS